MAQPLQYQNTFVPTDFGSVAQLAGLYSRDIAARDQRFDQGVAMENKLLSDLYGLETYQPEKLNSHIDKFANKIQQVVERRGGDYGAAAKDIARLGALELSNPIYKLNQMQVEQSKLLDRAVANNPNLWVLKNPKDIDLDSVTSPADINYVVADPATIDQSFERLLGSLRGRTSTTDPVLDKSGFYKYSTIKGATPQEIEKMKSSDEVFQNVLTNTPQLQELLSQYPEIEDRVRSRVNMLTDTLYGGQETRYMSPPVSRQGDTTNYQFRGNTPYYPEPKVREKIDNKINKFIESTELITSKDGNVQAPEQKSTKFSAPAVGQYGWGTSIGISKETDEQKAFNEFQNFTKEYSALYNNVKQAGGTDKDFLAIATPLEKSRAYTLEADLRIDNINFSGNTQRMAKPGGLKEFFTNEKGKKVSYGSFLSELKKSGLNPEDISVFVDPVGNIKTHTEDGIYTIDTGNLSEATKNYTNILKQTFSDFYNYKVSGDQVNQINNQMYNLGGGRYIGVQINPDNILDRRILTYSASEEGLVPVAELTDFNQLHQNIVPLIEADLQSTLYKPKQ